MKEISNQDFLIRELDQLFHPTMSTAASAASASASAVGEYGSHSRWSRTPEIKVDRDHVFRHAKELVNATHGRYLEGEVLLPCDDCLVQLSPVPSSESKQALQPNLLHVTVMNDSTRKATWKSTLTPSDWKIRVRVREGRHAVLLLQEDVEMPVNCVRNGRLVLGESGLLVTIITPLQGDRGDPGGIRVVDVISDRLRVEKGGDFMNQEGCARLAEQYTNKKKNPVAKIEMHRCRIQAEFFDMSETELTGKVVSADVCNSKHNDVGALELHDMSDPRCSCTLGGYKVLLSSEFKAPTLKKDTAEAPIRAVFVLERNGAYMPAERVVPGFNQISLKKDDFQIHHNTLAFLVPAQDPLVIRQLGGAPVKIALYRPHDNKYSATKFDFRYVNHVDDDCHFCAIMGRSKLPDYKTARRHIRRRVTAKSNSSSDSGCNPYSPSGSSSASSAVSSPRPDDCWSPDPPAAKTMRLLPADDDDFNLPDEFLENLLAAERQQHQEGNYYAMLPPSEATPIESGMDFMSDITDLLASDSTCGNAAGSGGGGFETLECPSEELIAMVKAQLGEEEDEEMDEGCCVVADCCEEDGRRQQLDCLMELPQDLIDKIRLDLCEEHDVELEAQNEERKQELVAPVNNVKKEILAPVKEEELVKDEEMGKLADILEKDLTLMSRSSGGGEERLLLGSLSVGLAGILLYEMMCVYSSWF